MNKRRISLFSFSAAVLVSLLVPALASAQSNSGPYWRRDRDNGRYGNNDRRVLRDVARRIKNRSHDFQRHLDEALDRSRYDDTRREDRINQDVRIFRNAADRFADRVDDSRDLNRSAGEARQLLSMAASIDRYVSRVRLDARTASDWSQLRNDLRTVADIYGLRFSDFDGARGGRNGGGWRWPN